MHLHHEFSVEVDPVKRKFILDAHTKPGSKPTFHLFQDVKCFKDGSGFCDTCNCSHKVPESVDLLFAGPSCKNLSGMFTERKQFSDCYKTGEGSSGYTYQHGVLDAIATTNPAVLYFENVVGVEQSRSVDGAKTVPPIQARWVCIYIIHAKRLYIYTYIRKFQSEQLNICVHE